jgi:proliferating cell nuclear antigen PCNA
MTKSSGSKEKKNKRILEVRTTQTAALKQAIEMISNVISDCCIVFIPPDESIQQQVDEDYEEVNSDDDEEPVKKSKSLKKGSKKILANEDSDDESESKKKKKSKSNDKKKKSHSSEESDTPSKKKPSKPVKKNTGGIRILRLTEDKNILIKLNLDAINFEHFFCGEQKITIGVDMNHFHALLKTVNDDNPVVLYMNKDNRSAIYIRSVNEKDDSSEETDIELFLMDIGNPDMPIPPTEFQNRVTMASDKFHTICKHLNNNSTFVEITSVGNQISFRGKSDGGKVTMSYKDTHESSKKNKDKPGQVVQGIYELRNLMCFSKCNKLCNTIDVYLRNDFPLVLVISVATLGKLYIFLTPIENGSL